MTTTLRAPTLTETELVRARRCAAHILSLIRRDPRPMGAVEVFGRAAEVAATTGARVLLDGDVAAARAFASAWAMLLRRQERARAVRSERLAADLRAVA